MYFTFLLSQTTSQFLQRCRDHPVPYLLPSQQVLDRPGGQLVYNIPAHNGTISGLDLTIDGKLAVTGWLTRLFTIVLTKIRIKISTCICLV